MSDQAAFTRLLAWKAAGNGREVEIYLGIHELKVLLIDHLDGGSWKARVSGDGRRLGDVVDAALEEWEEDQERRPFRVRELDLPEDQDHE